jgi:hypothetical protein
VRRAWNEGHGGKCDGCEPAVARSGTKDTFRLDWDRAARRPGRHGSNASCGCVHSSARRAESLHVPKRADGPGPAQSQRFPPSFSQAS